MFLLFALLLRQTVAVLKLAMICLAAGIWIGFGLFVLISCWHK
jgi:hypothetical protein